MDDLTAPPRTHPAAWLSFALGLSSFALGLLALTGVPALLIGMRSLRAVNASDGRLRGARLAVAGMVLGGLASLVTVLGVAAIVGLRMQDYSRRAECANHLRLIGVSLNKYADTHGTFPAAASAPAWLPPDRRLSWMAGVLPLLAEGTRANATYQELAGRIDREKAWDDGANAAAAKARVRLFLCPAGVEATPGMTHYVGVAGVGPDAAGRRRDDTLAGVFGYDRGVKREEVTAGVSYTMMVAETAERNGPWLAGGFPTVRGAEPGVEHYVGAGRPFGGLHHRVAQVLWVDASVRPVSEATPGDLFRACATLRRE
jgi:hypothetical protein